jgi:hypothetical protein
MLMADDRPDPVSNPKARTPRGFEAFKESCDIAASPSSA